MNVSQKSHYKSLDSQSARACFMLSIGVTAQLDTQEDLSIVIRAFVGDVKLPITGQTPDEVVTKGKQWLQRQAA
jgi:hypothetical protein